MDEAAQLFTVGKRFPEHMPVPQRGEVLALLRGYGISFDGEIRLIDSTHDENDVRLNYIIGKQWVLRVFKAPGMTEKRMGDLYRLIGRYLEAGILCPQFVQDENGFFLHACEPYQCSLSEYVDLPLAEEAALADEDLLIREVQAHTASFAASYRNVDLSDTMVMYSLFDLSPFDQEAGIYEKEDNFHQLIAALRDQSENSLAAALEAKHASVRARLKSVYRSLGRCVFQGDENFSNVLVDAQGHFKGFIDFNLAGTEVVVNQLANLVGFDYDEARAEPIGARARLDHAVQGFRANMRRVLEIYRATPDELYAMNLYAWIVMVAQWPTLCYFKDSLNGALRDEILALLGLLAQFPEETLTEGLTAGGAGTKGLL
ncbi:MAG: phosphotransferase [Clostridia bacterium]|nr:phosphotransferase [Clostridia bacterium]